MVNAQVSAGKRGGRVGSEPIASQIQSLISSWATYLEQVEGRAPATVRAYRKCAERFASDSGILSAREVSSAATERHFRRLFVMGLGESARSRTVQAIRLFCRYLVVHRHLESNPVGEVRTPKQYRKERAVLAVSEIKGLIGRPITSETLYPRFRDFRDSALLALTYTLALRAGEAGRIRTETLEWDSDEKVFSVLLEHSKHSAGDQRMVVSPALTRLLGAYLVERRKSGWPGPYLFPAHRGALPLSSRTVNSIFRARLVHSKIDRRGRRLTPHILRHSRATHLLDAGLDIRMVQRLMRHRSLETTAQYLHTTSEKILRSLRRKDPLGGASTRRSHFKGVAGFLADLSAGFS